jgi:predicted nucleic-acid-binding protein
VYVEVFFIAVRKNSQLAIVVTLIQRETFSILEKQVFTSSAVKVYIARIARWN